MAFSGFQRDRHGVSLLQLQLSSAIIARCCRSLLSLVAVSRFYRARVPVCLLSASEG